MAALLIWSLVDIESPRIITTDMQVIDLLEVDPCIWTIHISQENKQRIVNEIFRWKLAIKAGADAIEAYGYAVNGGDIDFNTWLSHESKSLSIL